MATTRRSVLKSSTTGAVSPAPARIIPEAAPIAPPIQKTKYSLEVGSTKDGSVTIILPAEAAEYLGLPKENPAEAPLYFLPLNGVIQVSAHEPGVSIPDVPINADAFLAQTN